MSDKTSQPKQQGQPRGPKEPREPREPREPKEPREPQQKQSQKGSQKTASAPSKAAASSEAKASNAVQVYLYLVAFMYSGIALTVATRFYSQSHVLGHLRGSVGDRGTPLNVSDATIVAIPCSVYPGRIVTLQIEGVHPAFVSLGEAWFRRAEGSRGVTSRVRGLVGAVDAFLKSYTRPANKVQDSARVSWCLPNHCTLRPFPLCSLCHGI